MNHDATRRSYLTWGAALGIAIAAAIVFWPEAADSSAPQAQSAQRTQDALMLTPTTAAASDIGDSLSDAVEQMARLIDLGVSGDLRVDSNMRGTLDVLMAELGSAPSERDLQRLEEAMRQAMPGEAATQGIALVRHYVDYHRAALADAEAAAKAPPANAAELQALLDKTIALRRKHFDPATADALFGAEEAHARYALAQQAIQADPRLSPQERAGKLQALRAQLPAEAATWQAPATLAITEMEDKVAALRAQGATPAQIEQLRQRYVGAEAAASMAAMEAQREQWDTRYQAYLAQKKALSASSGSEASQQLDSLQRKHFSDDELAAVRAYDRAHQQ